MILIISNDKIYTNNNSLRLESSCMLKDIKDNNNILIIKNKKVDKDGIIDDKIIIDEIFITLNINFVVCDCYYEALINSCNYFNVPLIVL